MRRKDPLSILLLDDNADLVEVYKDEMARTDNLRVAVHTDGYRARALAERQLFDVLVIDAKLHYRGAEFGGLRLADDLRSRYGTNSILIISRFITVDLMREHGLHYEFLEKYGGDQTRSFVRHLVQRMRHMRRRQYIFVAMPFAKDFAPLYTQRIRPGIEAAGFRCVRVDEVTHNRPIQEVIFELVENSKLVVFVADGENANAYYEAGFADAMGKEVIIVAKSLDVLKFDVANRHTITYSNRPSSLPVQLKRKLRALRLTEPLVI